MRLRLPQATYNRSVGHWTVGTYTPSASDRAAYQITIDGDGQPIYGSKPLDVNSAGKRLVGSTYYAHTRALNSGAFGVGIASMRGAHDRPFQTGAFPILPRQVDAYTDVMAEVNVFYGIAVERRTNLTHAEVAPTLGVPQAGKWDIRWLPGDPGIRDAIAIGDELRQEIARKMGLQPVAGVRPISPLPLRPTLRRGAPATQREHIIDLQRALTGAGWATGADGVFGPQTDRHVRAFQRSQQLLDDGIVGRMTWTALGLWR